MFMTKYVGSNVLVSVLLVSWWSLNCVSVVVGVLVAVWWCVPSVLAVFGDVSGVLLMSWWCFCGVLAMWYSRNSIFLTKLAPPSIRNWRQRNETRHFAIWGCMLG